MHTSNNPTQYTYSQEHTLLEKTETLDHIYFLLIINTQWIFSHRHKSLRSDNISQIYSPWMGYIIDFGIVLSYRPASQCGLPVPEDAGIKTRTVATLALAVKLSNYLARSHPQSARFYIHGKPTVQSVLPVYSSKISFDHITAIIQCNSCYNHKHIV